MNQLATQNDEKKFNLHNMSYLYSDIRSPMCRLETSFLKALNSAYKTNISELLEVSIGFNYETHIKGT